MSKSKNFIFRYVMQCISFFLKYFIILRVKIKNYEHQVEYPKHSDYL